MRKYFIGLLIILGFLSGCGEEQFIDHAIKKVQESNKVSAKKDNNINEMDNHTDDQEIEQAITTAAEKTEAISMKEIITLLDSIGQKRKEVVETIEEKGWYESIEEIEPTLAEFEEAIRPIISTTFTDNFIDSIVLENMEAFFCYCDATGPLLGSMKLDMIEGLKQDGNQATFYAYLPSNEINSGAKWNVSVIRDDEQWKIDSWTPILSSHEKSFNLTKEHIIDYYRVKETELEYKETIVGRAFNEDVFIFHNVTKDELIAVNSRDWYTLKGTEQVQEMYYD